MELFYTTDEAIKSGLLRQNHADFNKLASALRNETYEIVRIHAPSPAADEFWGPRSGQAVITYNDGRFLYERVLNLYISGIGHRHQFTHYAAGMPPLTIPEGEMTATWHASGTGIVAMRVPSRIATILEDMAPGAMWENKEEVARMRERGRIDAEMEWEAEHDPEGAFGGRGNNWMR